MATSSISHTVFVDPKASQEVLSQYPYKRMVTLNTPPSTSDDHVYDFYLVDPIANKDLSSVVVPPNRSLQVEVAFKTQNQKLKFVVFEEDPDFHLKGVGKCSELTASFFDLLEPSISVYRTGPAPKLGSRLKPTNYCNLSLVLNHRLQIGTSEAPQFATASIV